MPQFSMSWLIYFYIYLFAYLNVSVTIQSSSGKQPTFRDATMLFPQNDVWGTSAEIPYWWLVTTQIRVVVVIGLSKFSTNQKHHPDLGSDASSVWNCCARFSDVISRRNQRGGVPKYQLFSQAVLIYLSIVFFMCQEASANTYRS